MKLVASVFYTVDQLGVSSLCQFKDSLMMARRERRNMTGQKLYVECV